MIPPWIKAQEMEKLDWENEGGRKYMCQFIEWFNALSCIKKKEYMMKNPVIEGWKYLYETAA